MKIKTRATCLSASLRTALALWSLSSCALGQAQPRSFGVYRTQDDYERGEVQILGVPEYPGDKVFQYTDLRGEKQKLKVSRCDCWGIKYRDQDYLVHDGKSYRIVFIGAISLYTIGPIDIEKTGEDSYKVTTYVGAGGKKVYFHPGKRGVPERLTSRKRLAEHMQDDPEALTTLEEGSGMLFNTWLMSVLKAVILYNKHHD